MDSSLQLGVRDSASETVPLTLCTSMLAAAVCMCVGILHE